jgi:predicted amidohydrolase
VGNAVTVSTWPGRLRVALATCKQHSAWLPDTLAALIDVLQWHNLGLAYATLSAAEIVELDSFRGQYLPDLRDAQDHVLGSLTEELKNRMTAILSDLQAGLRQTEALREIYFAAHCMDSVFWGLMSGPTMSYRSAYLSEYRFLYRSGESLIHDARIGGLLLPRSTRKASPARAVADLFDNMVRIELPTACEVDYNILDQTSTHADGLLRLGVIPAIQQASELEWQADIHRRTYQVRLAAAAEASVVNRTLAALDWLLSKEAEIILMPELVSSTTLLRRIKQWRASRVSSFPRLIVAGSHLCPSTATVGKLANRAHIIGSSGMEMWAQNKMNPYTYTAQHQIACNHLLSTPPVDLVEDIDRLPVIVAVRDTLAGERLAVLICEDFARDLPHRATLVSMGVNRLLVPVMNGARGSAHDWIARHGITYANEPFAVSLVANSATLVSSNGHMAERVDLAAIFSPNRGNLLITNDFRPDGKQIDAVFMKLQV